MGWPVDRNNSEVWKFMKNILIKVFVKFKLIFLKWSKINNFQANSPFLKADEWSPHHRDRWKLTQSLEISKRNGKKVCQTRRSSATTGNDRFNVCNKNEFIAFGWSWTTANMPSCVSTYRLFTRSTFMTWEIPQTLCVRWKTCEHSCRCMLSQR